MSHVWCDLWDDIIIFPSALNSGADDPDQITFGASGNILALGFNGSGAPAIEQMYGSFEIPHSYREGTNLDFHVHWCPTTTNAGNVVWQVEYTVVNIDGTFPASATIATAPTAAGGTAWVHKLTDMSQSISGTGIKIGAVCMFRFFRDNANAGDTYADDAALLSLGVHYKVDSNGSVGEYTK